MKVRRSSSVLLSSFSIVLFLLLFASPRTLSAQGWRMEGRNPSRTNAVPVNGPETLPTFTALPNAIQGSLRRIAPDGSFVLVDPSGANGLGVVSTYAKDGTPKWSVPAPNAAKIVDVAVAKDGTVYVSTAGAVSALNANTGSSPWTFVTEASESSPLAIGSTGTIYFHSAATGNPTVETLSAINPDGSEKWQGFGSFRGNTRLVLSTDEQLAYLINTKSFLGSPVGNVSAYSTADGSKVSDTPCDPRGDVYVFSQWNVLYTGNVNSDLLAFSPDIQSCPTIPGQGELNAIVTTTPTGRIIAGNLDGTIKALAQNGGFLWRSVEPLTQVFSSLDGTVYGIAPFSNAIVAISGETGAELWRSHFVEQVDGLLVGDDGILYVKAAAKLYASAPLLGRIDVQANIPQASFSINNQNGAVASVASASGNFPEPPGPYTIKFNDVPGFVTPIPKAITVISGQSVTVLGIYQALPRIVSVVPSTINRGELFNRFTVVGSGFQSISELSFDDPAITILKYDSRVATQIIADVDFPSTVPFGPHSLSVSNPGVGVATTQIIVLPETVTRSAPFDASEVCSGKPNATRKGAITFTANDQTGALALEAFSTAVGQAHGDVGVGISYMPVANGTLHIEALVSINANSFDGAFLTPVPLTSGIGIASISSAATLLVRNGTTNSTALNQFRSVVLAPIPIDDNFVRAIFAKEIAASKALKDLISQGNIFEATSAAAQFADISFDARQYNPPITLLVQMDVPVTKGLPIDVCSGLFAKVVTSSFAFLSFSKVSYKGEVQQMTITPINIQ